MPPTRRSTCPQVLRHLDPALFPRDAPLIDTQARLMFNDEIVALIARATGASLPVEFLALYGLTLLTLLFAITRLGGHYFKTGGAVVALAAALTLRHAIARTGTNTLEGYFHPRQFAFALGLLALAMFIERRHLRALIIMIVVAAMHPTTALWFAVWLLVVAWVARASWRPRIIWALTAAGLVAVWMLWRGPLAPRLHRMDSDWLAVIADKDYLFPMAWPLNAWVTNLVSLPIIVWAWRARRRAGLLFAEETGIVFGALALAAVFAVSLPLDAARVALAVQLQVGRVFWMLDILATIYVVWVLAEGREMAPKVQRRASLAASVLIVLSVVRGTYNMSSSSPIARSWRSTSSIRIGARRWRGLEPHRHQPDGWRTRCTPRSTVRAYGPRVTVMCCLMRRRTRRSPSTIAASPCAWRTDAGLSKENAWNRVEGAQALARRYGLDYLVTSGSVDLPVAYRAGSLTVYRLR